MENGTAPQLPVGRERFLVFALCAADADVYLLNTDAGVTERKIPETDVKKFLYETPATLPK